jgi:hypothetical protein
MVELSRKINGRRTVVILLPTSECVWKKGRRQKCMYPLPRETEDGMKKNLSLPLKKQIWKISMTVFPLPEPHMQLCGKKSMKPEPHFI